MSNRELKKENLLNTELDLKFWETTCAAEIELK